MESENQEGSTANSWFNAYATLWQGRHERFQPQVGVSYENRDYGHVASYMAGL